MKVQRTPSELAQRFVIEIARDVTRRIAHAGAHDLVVDAADAAIHRREDTLVDLAHRQAARGDGREVDQWSRGGQRMKRVRAGLEIPLDEPFAGNAGDALL